MQQLQPAVLAYQGDQAVALDPYEGLDVDETRLATLEAIAALRRFARPIAPAEVVAELDAWSRVVFLAPEEMVRVAHHAWSVQIRACVAMIRTVGGMC